MNLTQGKIRKIWLHESNWYNKKHVKNMPTNIGIQPTIIKIRIEKTPTNPRVTQLKHVIPMPHQIANM